MTQNPNPFAQMDVSKMFETFKSPVMDMGSLMEMQRKNMQALMDANRVAAEGYRSLMARQVEMMREGFEQFSKTMQTGMTQPTSTDTAGEQVEAIRDNFEQAFTHFRELAEMASDAHGEAFKIMQDRLSEQMDEFKSLGEETVKAAQAGAGEAAKAAPKAKSNGAAGKSAKA